MTGSSLSLDERAELERLRAETSKLHTERTTPGRRPLIGSRPPARPATAAHP